MEFIGYGYFTPIVKGNKIKKALQLEKNNQIFRQPAQLGAGWYVTNVDYESGGKIGIAGCAGDGESK